MITRREILSHIGTIGGVGAAAAAMQAMGLFGEAMAAPLPDLPSDHGRGRHVVILGAGIAGLVTGYELEQAGYRVTIIEARDRVGGRAWTVRDGDKIELVGEKVQTARYSQGVYFNAGPARLPSWHEGILGYARKFNVPLEVEVNSSRSAYIVGKNGNRVRMRTAINDLRGHLSELLAKAVSQGALDQSLTLEERHKLLPFLQGYGDLDGQSHFAGSQRSGFGTPPGAGTSSFATPAAPMSLDTLLANEMLPATLFEENAFMQATMFQPVGGMDQIARGIATGLSQPPTLGAEVTRIRQTRDGVEVAYIDRASGSATMVKADLMVCTIPFNVLSRIDANFSKPVATAIGGVTYDNAAKVAFEAPRFWEREQIYGGISFVGGETGVIWYPSAGMHSARGMLLACYSIGENSVRFEKRPLDEQIAIARAAVEAAHPGHGADCVDPLVVNWSKVKYSEGPWPAWDHQRAGLQEAHIESADFKLLNEPDGRIYFAGAALSQITGWQEGAIMSAHATIAKIAKRTTAMRLAEPTLRPAMAT